MVKSTPVIAAGPRPIQLSRIVTGSSMATSAKKTAAAARRQRGAMSDKKDRAREFED
jgi:hypothetical protein